MKKKKVEQEKMELLKMKEVGFWTLFIGLVVSVLTQLFLLGADFTQIAGETLILMLGGVAVIAGGIRNGKEYMGMGHRLRKSVLFSAIIAIIADVILGIGLYLQSKGSEVAYKEIFTTLAVVFLVIWLLGSITLFFLEMFVHHKQKKVQDMEELEAEDYALEDEDEEIETAELSSLEDTPDSELKE